MKITTYGEKMTHQEMLICLSRYSSYSIDELNKMPAIRVAQLTDILVENLTNTLHRFNQHEFNQEQPKKDWKYGF